MKYLSILFAAVCACCLVAAAGCIGTDKAPNDLTENPWILDYFVGGNIAEHPAEGSMITLAFSQDRSYSGNGGINNYQGTYTVSGKNLTLGKPSSTKMGGSAALTAQENQYLSNLEAVASYTVTDRKLTVYDTAGNTIMIFEEYLV
ncbi:MAG: META domain-containing protein [Methanocorpusculum sp.]|nr:META domain-containing protein [Methanocorpusculum sp.]MDE2519321.1 META domain-containing protein [Methanocorpusculum sp.]MDE2522759.1 META domain-containing protein [Methanocorpusculum sp.]MDE2524135.1 META domain-containing protein [Methanocorpusculum sp.]